MLTVGPVQWVAVVGVDAEEQEDGVVAGESHHRRHSCIVDKTFVISLMFALHIIPVGQLIPRVTKTYRI